MKHGMKHRETPVMRLHRINREQEDKIADLEKKIEAANKWADYCMGVAIKRTSEEVLKKGYLKQFKVYQ